MASGYPFAPAGYATARSPIYLPYFPLMNPRPSLLWLTLMMVTTTMMPMMMTTTMMPMMMTTTTREEQPALVLCHKATKQNKHRFQSQKNKKADDRYLLGLSRTSAMTPSLLACPSLLLFTPQRFLHAADSAFQV